jgi:HK97 family phage portal protein
MGLFSGPRERRYNGFTAQFSNPPILPNSASATYTAMNLTRADTALQKVAVWSSVALLANICSELPIGVFTGSPDAAQWAKPVPAPGYMEDIAGDGYGTADWVYASMVSYLLRGNKYGKIAARDSRGGFPTQVPLYAPDSVRGWIDTGSGRPTWRVNGVEVDASTMWHRRAYPLPGSLLGLSPIAYQAQTIGLGLSAQQFGTQFFDSGGNPTGLLVNTEMDLNKDVATTAKERFIAAMNGRREPVVMGKGWDWKQISIAPEESQFLETQKYTSTECARIYGPGVPEILGYEVGGSMTYANVEQRNLHLLVYTLDPWLSRLERELTAMLPRPRFARFDRSALLRTDQLTRYKTHAIAVATRFMAPSEIRTYENLPPITAEQLAELEFVPTPELAPESVTPPTK